MIRLLAPDDPALQALLANPQITVDIVPWAEYRDRLMQNLEGETTAYQGLCIPGNVWLPELANAGFFHPLDELHAQMEHPDFDKDDFLPLAMQEAHFEGHWYLLPLFSDGHIVFYDTDVIELPEGRVLSTGALYELAKTAHQAPERYGIALKAHPSEIFLDFYPFWLEANVPLLDENDHAAFNTPAGVQALEQYCALREFAPPDTHNYGNAEIAAALQQRQVAIATTWGGQAAPIFGTAATPYRAAVFPKPWNATWSIAIPRNLAENEALQALDGFFNILTPELDLKIIESAGSPVRKQSYAPQYLQRYFWLGAQKQMLERAQILPLRPEVGQFLGALYEAVYAAFVGDKTSAQALSDAESAVNIVMQKD